MITQNDVQRLFNTDVYETDGTKIGSTGQVYLDRRSGEPEWVSVKTGLFGTKETLVPLQSAELAEDRIVVPFGKDQIKNAPRVQPDDELSPAEEDELYRYYGFESSGGDLIENGGTDRDYTATGTDRDYTASGTESGYTRSETDRGISGTGQYTGTGNGDRSSDDAMTRSEERLVADTRREEAGRARLRKYVVTEQQQVEVPVTREEVRLEREPVTDANVGAATDGPGITESEHEITLHAERPVVQTEAVPVERVRLGKETVTDTERVEGEVRKEQIDYDGPDADRR
jgi:uncharacterized protein (TIGR02271 family)